MPTPPLESPATPVGDAELNRATRAPQQERGQRRVEQILDAAEKVFTEVGVGAATMQMIAERADASMGSLYHFFPNKDAIVEELGARYANAVKASNEQAMPLEMVHLPVEELFDRVFQAQMQLIADMPAFDAVHGAVHRNCPAIYDALNQALVGHVGKFLALRYPTMPEGERAASAMVSVAAVHAIVELASRLPLEFRQHTIREAHAMFVRHYAQHDARYGVAVR